MKRLTDIIREAMELATDGPIVDRDGLMREALTALSELERMAGEQEPVAVRWCREGYHWTYEDYKLGMFYGRWVKAERPYTAAQMQAYATQARADLEAEVQRLREAIQKQLDPSWECNSNHPALYAALEKQP